MARLSLGIVTSAILFAILSLLLGCSVASGKSVEDRDWIEVRTANFRIYSVQNEKNTIELARYLEMFRVAVSIVTNVSTTKASIPINIFAVKGVSDMRSLGIEGDPAGMLMQGQRDYTIVIRNARGMDENSVILHEYVHFLIRNHGGLVYPKWFDEGFAEYLSGGGIRRGHFDIGRIPEDQRQNLLYTSWIPMRKVVSPDGYSEWRDEKQAMFYAQAWALVHYLQNRPDRESSFSQDMEKFLTLAEAGQDDITAFEQAFGVTVDRLNRQVKKYLQGGLTYLRMSADDLLPIFEPEVVNLSRERASLGLAKVALKSGDLDRAETLFTIAIADESTRPQAEAGLGNVLKFAKEYEAARPHFEKAVELAPDDPYCQLDMAEYWHSRARDSDETKSRTEFLELARSHYVKAWKLDDSMPEIYAMYARTFLLEGKQYDKAIEMLEEAEYLLPSDLRIRMSLGEAYARVGRTDDAIKAARSVLAWSHAEGRTAKWAKETLAQLEAGKAGPESEAEAGSESKFGAD